MQYQNSKLEYEMKFFENYSSTLEYLKKHFPEIGEVNNALSLLAIIVIAASYISAFVYVTINQNFSMIYFIVISGFLATPVIKIFNFFVHKHKLKNLYKSYLENRLIIRQKPIYYIGSQKYSWKLILKIMK